MSYSIITSITSVYVCEIPTRKNLGPTKARCHDGTRPARPTMARDPRNLAQTKNNQRRIQNPAFQS